MTINPARDKALSILDAARDAVFEQACGLLDEMQAAPDSPARRDLSLQFQLSRAAHTKVCNAWDYVREVSR